MAVAASFAAVSYELGRRTDRVQESSALAAAIRSRMPVEAVEAVGKIGSNIGSNKAVQRLRPLASRMAIFGESAPAAAEEQLDPTLVQMDFGETNGEEAPAVQTGRADDTDFVPAVPIDRQDWATAVGPQVSGDGVWVSPKETPPSPGDDGQYRLWD